MANDSMHNADDGLFAQLSALLKEIAEDPSSASRLAEEIEQSVFSIEDDAIQQISTAYSGPAEAMNTAHYAIRALLSKQLESEEFYERLWEFISSSSLFSTEEERAAVLLLVLSDPRLPYVKFPIVEIDDDRFGELLEMLDGELHALSRAAILPFARKTDEASAVLSVVDSHKEDDERAVMLAYYLQLVRGANQ